MNEIKAIDLFGGIGGFRLGLEQVSDKFSFIWYCDNEPNAVKIYNKNFQEEWQPTDIRTVQIEEIPSHDLLCAGFPCQSFSVAGRREGFQDTRGTLFYEICRVAQAKKPRLLFLENVKGLLSADDGRCFYTILLHLDELGYDVEWQVFNSKYYGVPQQRERIFIIGHNRKECTRQIFPITETTGTPEEVSFAIDANYWKGIAKPEDYFEKHRRQIVFDRKGFDSRTKGFKMYKGITPTLTRKMGTGGNNVPILIDAGRIRRGKWGDGIHYGNSSSGRDFILDEGRRLTPIECERLQGFPDGWTEGISDTQRYIKIGNAVTINVIEYIGKYLS